MIIAHRTKTLILLLFFLLLPLTASADLVDETFDHEGEINATLGFEGWFTQANAKWQISFPHITSDGTHGRVESEVAFRKIDSPIMTVTTEGRIDENFSFDMLTSIYSGTMRTGTILNGRGTDTDRFIPDGGNGYVFSDSRNRTTGSVRLWGFNVYYRSGGLSAPDEDVWGVVAGFLHYEDNLRMTAAVQTASRTFDNIDFPDPGSHLTGLNSTYDFRWDLLKVGIIRNAKLFRKCTYRVAVSVYPLVSYRGEGFWNLRSGTNPDNFRKQPPNFVQKADMGFGYEAQAGLAYHFSEKAELAAGYRYFSLYAGKGTDTTYFADGSSFQDRLDWVTVTRHGAYTELVLKF